MKLFSLFFMLMFAVCVFARPSMQLVDANEPILQDSLVTDSLSKISLANDVDTNTIVDTNKVELIDAGIEKTSDVNYEYFPNGFYMEIAYHAPSVIQIPFFGIRNNRRLWGKDGVGAGMTALSVDVDIRPDGVRISDEMLWAFVLSVSIYGNPNDPTINREKRDRISEWVEYIMIGNTYWALSQNAKIGLFESHHFVDYLFSSAAYSEFWEFGWSQAVGLRYVYSGNAKDGGAYIDLGAHVRITNKHFLFGVFVQLGIFGNHK
ncbi:MAG: hypothetical protein II670_01950 [Alphaproteobacteria bacterium]|nr:hypothetical protein [Alphaproteobacteria bacterium]